MTFINEFCFIIKDENNLEEFIIYHHLIGVEHFFIYDNESKIPIKKRLDHNFFKNICSVIEIKGSVQQINAYNDCIKKTKNNVNWLIVIDGDEFIYLKKHKHINSFLNDYKECHAIGINWLMFGSSFHEEKQKGLVIDNYIYCKDSQDKHIKTICKPRYVSHMPNPHYVVLHNPQLYMDTHRNVINGPFNENKNDDIIRINHYWGKSLEDMEEKVKRGRAPTQEKRKMPKNYHMLYNKVCNKELKNMFSKKVNEKMNDLKIYNK